MAFVSCREIAVHYTGLRRHSGYDMGAGCMNATRSVGSLRLARQRHESDSTQEMRRFTYSKIIAVL